MVDINPTSALKVDSVCPGKFFILQTKHPIDGLYLAFPDVTCIFVLAVCLGTGILIVTPSASTFAPKTLLTFTFTSMRVLPNSLIVGNTRKGRLTPSVIRYQ
uniref:Uncharacterized protein n=1 Tax=Opuntia streptacantha TaxID=393608 RepID=A0A7C9D105_OPUST